jgi:uroporphyrinogen-III synthase
MKKKIKILSTKKIKESLKKKYDFQIFDYNFLEISYCLDKEKIEKILENKNNIFIFTSNYAIKSILKIFEKEKLKNLKAFAIE